MADSIRTRGQPCISRLRRCPTKSLSSTRASRPCGGLCARGWSPTPSRPPSPTRSAKRRAVCPWRTSAAWTRSSCLRSEEHTSELQSRNDISYAVFCLKKKIIHKIEQQVNDVHNRDERVIALGIDGIA